jgi:hypothetical protein
MEEPAAPVPFTPLATPFTNSFGNTPQTRTGKRDPGVTKYAARPPWRCYSAAARMTSGVAAARTSFDPLGAGALLLAVLVVCVGAGALLGWALDSAGIGIAIGAVIGIPASIFAVYRAHRGAF